MNFYKKIEYTTPESTKKAIQAALEDYKLIHLVVPNLQLSTHEFYTDLSNYFTFSLDDIDTLTRKCGLIPEKFIVLSKEKRLASGYIRVNSHKC